MSDITDRLRSLARYEHADLSIGDEAADEIELLRRHVERLRKRDMEAAEHVESVICMRTHFTGEPEKPRPSGRGGIGRHATRAM